MRLHDSNYGRDHALDSESFPQDLRIPVELALPELGTDDDSLGTILRFRGKKNSPQNWFRPQQAEQIRSYIFHTQGPRLAETGNAGCVVETDQRNIFEDVVLFLPVHQLRYRGRDGSIRMS